jgi:peptidoglycan L-alanyl-D-glutamate endopeptidase CwlK
MTLSDYQQQAQEILDNSSDDVKTQLSRIKAEDLYPPFLAKIVETLQQLLDEGLSFWSTTGLRTVEEQDAIYLIGRRGIEGEHIKTTEKGGQSAHQYGIAADFAYDLDPDRPGLQPSWDVPHLTVLGNKAVENGLESGMFWTTLKDGPHLQMPIRGLGISPRNQLFNAYKAGGMLGVFEYLDQQNWG